MANKGYILVHRKIWDNQLFQGERFGKLEAWLYLISHANYKEGSINTAWGAVRVGHGQLYTNIRYLSLIFQWDKSTVSRFLEKLTKLKMITQKSSPHGTLITILNYSKYQYSSDKEIKNADTEPDTDTDTDADTGADTESPLLNTNSNTNINTSINTSINTARAPRGDEGRIFE